jgi:intracellular septation protein
MEVVFELLPLILFFVAYKVAGIFIATAVLMAASLAQISFIWLRKHRIDKMPLITAVLALVLGGLTLALHDADFIKWKFSIIEWLFGAVFLATNFIGATPLIQRMLGAKLELPAEVWRRLNLLYAGFFLILGSINVYVIYHFSTNGWMNFKFYGGLAATFIFMIVQGFYVVRHMPPVAEKS